MNEVYSRRCATCHDNRDNDANGNASTLWRSIHLEDARRSRMLQAPLARSAGGWQSCNRIVFADVQDQDYQRLQEVLVALQLWLIEHPRADIMSTRAGR